MATIAIGDIHGNLAALDDLLGQIRGELTVGDTLVFLGDYIDRGPDTKGCIDAVLRFRRETDARVVCLMGNHEDWFLQTMRDHHHHSWLLVMDAFVTIRSYSPKAEQVVRDTFAAAKAKVYARGCALPYDTFFAAVPPEHVRFFRRLRPYHRTADGICTHAGLDPRGSRLAEQARHAVIWGRPRFPEDYVGADLIVYGHMNNATLDADRWPHPTFVGRTIGVDTISHGVLTAVRLPDQRIFQSARHRVAG
jgi:serine/threonine protein phosphatase 1